MMLSAFESVFGPGDTVEVYTSQRRDVVDKLQRGEMHVQPWKDSAAHEFSRGRHWRLGHRRAYLWMAREFKGRMGRELLGAPAFVSFDRNTTVGARDAYLDRASDIVLTLRVPRSEVLLSMYQPWADYVLEGWCTDHAEKPIRAFERRACACAFAKRRASWETIFSLGDDSLRWQGVIDRIDPRWIVSADSTPWRAYVASGQPTVLPGVR